MSRQVFISYAHADNLPLDEGIPGWVSAFVDKLERTVKRQSGGGEVTFWMDHRLEPQRRVDEELRQRIQHDSYGDTPTALRVKVNNIQTSPP